MALRWRLLPASSGRGGTAIVVGRDAESSGNSGNQAPPAVRFGPGQCLEGLVMLRHSVLVFVAGVGSVLAAPASEPLAGGAVRVLHEDVDADGEAEIILENEFLRVDLFSGRVGQRQALAWWRRALGQSLPTPAPKYNCRFMGPGWIGNIVYKPTARRWLADAVMPTEAWRGIPEEFEQAVRMRETSPGVWRCLKIGVGVCEGRGWCIRDTLTLLDPGHWEIRTEAVSGGGKAVTFEQTLDAGDGYAYRYSKRLTLMPGDSRLAAERTLVNTGSRDLETTWYTHAFWGQGQGGRFDEQCWATVPLRRGPGTEAMPEMDTESCPIGNPAGAGYWGPLDGALVGDAWYACGNHARSELFLHTLADIPAFYRVWTCAPTYSLEPFRHLHLAPGQSERWSETMACGVGLNRIDTHDGLAAYSAAVSAATEDAPARIELRGVPFCEIRNGLLRIAMQASDGVEKVLERPLDAAGPGTPFSVCLDDWVDRLPLRVCVRLDAAGVRRADNHRERLGWLHINAPSADSPDLPGHAAGAAAILLLPADRAGDHALPPNRGAAFLSEYLEAAGFSPEPRADREGVSGAVLSPPALVVCPGLRGLPVGVWREVEQFVRGGGGLLVCGPIEPLAFEFTDLLPIRGAGPTLRFNTGPRDGTREFLAASRRRYQLSPVLPHAVTAALPWFPASYQDIGVLQDLAPAPGAEVLLRYQTPDGLLPEVTSPALVVSAYGQGRVAVLASPVDWGGPPHWHLWSRVGEHHRRFFMRLALWTAAGALPLSASTPPSSDCGSRPGAE
jgi:hypothetical protein